MKGPDTKMDHNSAMKTTTKASLHNQECFVQEIDYRILLELGYFKKYGSHVKMKGFFIKPYSSNKNIKVEVDLWNYATKSQVGKQQVFKQFLLHKNVI